MADLDYVKIVGRLGIVRADGPDTGDEPDLAWCDEGTLLFEPAIKQVQVAGAVGGPFTTALMPIEATIDADGWITLNGQKWLWLVDLGSGKVNPSIPIEKGTYTVSFIGVKCQGQPVKFAKFSFHPLPGPDNDITLLTPVDVGGGITMVIGDSAYIVAVKNGFVGTQAEWLASLQGLPGGKGDPGDPGDSAYAVALEGGFVGTQAEWLASLRGPQGVPGLSRTLVEVDGVYPPRPDPQDAPVLWIGATDPTAFSIPGDVWQNTDADSTDGEVYAQSVHGHVISDVAGLQAALTAAGTDAQTKADAAQAAAEAASIPAVEKGAPSGVAELGADGKLPESRVPDRLSDGSLTAAYAEVTVATGAGIDPTGAANSTAALQAKIDSVRDLVRTSVATPGCVLVIPGGRYKITTTLTLPPYVRLRTAGTVIFEWAGGNSTCLHITPLADDPDPLYVGLDKQQINHGPVIDGDLIIRSTATVDGSAVGLEVGSSTDLGVNRVMKFYSLRGISVTRFDTQLKLNTFNHYIGRFENCHFELAGMAALGGTNVQIGDTGTPNTNSGENFEFSRCVFAGAANAIKIDAAGWDLNFNNCSFDYLDRVATITQGYGRLAFQGGHIEAIDDAVLVSTAPDFAHVDFEGTTFLVATSRAFRGNTLILDGTIYQRPAGEFLTFSEGLFMTDDSDARGLRNLHQLGKRRPLTAAHNMLPDPSFAGEPTGVAGSPMTNWTFDAGSVGVEIVTDAAVTGGKGLQLTLAPGGYITLTARHVIPVRDLTDRYATAVFKTSDNGFNAAFGAVYTNPDGTDRAPLGLINPYRPRAFTVDTWEAFETLTDVLGAGLAAAVGVKPQILVSNPTGSAITVTIGYVYFGR